MEHSQAKPPGRQLAASDSAEAERLELRTLPTRDDAATSHETSAGLGLCVVYTECANLAPGYALARGQAARIGRHSEYLLPLIDDAEVSRNHAELEWHADIPVVRDLGSTNGTWVNGRSIERCALKPHSVLRVGSSVLCVTSYEQAQVGAASKPSTPSEPSLLVGGSWLHALREQLARIARSELSVVVNGESGTGKEPVARELHNLSGRGGRFVAVNCTSLPAALIESELFGYKRGAFSGASQDKPGLVRAADGGTLFLDEIGDMPLEAQAKLLRVLQEREVLPLGATRPEPVDLRVVCATHRDLESEVAHGTFRGDLMARVRQFLIKLPPLRERRADLLPLVLHFLRELGRTDQRPTSSFMHALACYPFPYNVRELKSAVQVASTLAPGRELKVEHLPENLRPLTRESARPAPSAAPSAAAPAGPPAQQPASVPPDAETLRALLEKHGGNISAVSRELKKDRVQIHRWLRRYGIDPGSERR